MSEALAGAKRFKDSFWTGAKDWAKSLKHPILDVIAFGLAVRFLVMLLAMVYDSDYWAVVVRNLEAGEGLYDMEGYYYTPVWGYILALVAAFQDSVLSLGDSATRVAEMIYIEGSGHQTTATVTSLVFNFTTKLPLVLSDALLAYLVYRIVKRTGGSEQRAVYGFALTFLCPVIIGASGIIGMPDSISALFMMLCLVLALEDRPFVAGMCFAMAFSTKFFPVFLLFPLIAYVYVKHGDRRRGLEDIVKAAIGAVLVLIVIFLPDILSGDLDRCFQFISDRASSSSGDGFSLIGIVRIVVYVLVIIASVFAARAVYLHGQEGLDRYFLEMCLAVEALCLIYPPTTQYIVVLVPLLAWRIAVGKGEFSICWKLLAVGATLVFCVSIPTDLLPLAVSVGFPEVSSLSTFFDVWNAGIGVFNIWNILFVVGSVIQYLGIVAVLLLMYGDRYLPGLMKHFDRGETDGA